jgi:Na+/proline symporter
MAFTVATLVPGRTVFWFVIFGWSGIAATFCPTIILSLFWSKFTARGAMTAMIVGFIGVPIFKFGAPALPEIGWAFTALSELPPAFLLSGIAGVLVSLMDPAGQAALNDISDELDEAAS